MCIHIMLCGFFCSLVVSLTKCINSRPALQVILQLFSVEKLKSCVHKVNVFIDGETNIFQVYYIVFVKDLILSFPLRPRRKYVWWLERNHIYHHLSSLLKNGHLQMTLELKLRMGKFPCFMQILLQSKIQWFHVRDNV